MTSRRAVAGKARLYSSSRGYYLVPHDDGGQSVAARLYGEETVPLFSQDERYFEAGRSLDEVVQFVANIAGNQGYLVQRSRQPRAPLLTFRLADPPAPVPETIGVDLKWALWSRDEGHWFDHAPGVWERMRAAFEGSGPALRVGTAPRKEIRYGSVLVERGRATACFRTEWDELHCHVPEGIPDERREEAESEVESWFYEGPFTCSPEDGEPIGAEIVRERRARTFGVLMARVDDVEVALLARDEAAGQELERLQAELVARYATEETSDDE